MNKPNHPHEKEDFRNMMIAIALSLGILLVYQVFFEKKVAEPAAQQVQIEQKAVVVAAEQVSADAMEQAQEMRLDIHNDKVSGSISLRGSRLDDLLLNDHFMTVEDKDHVPLLMPASASHSYYIESGWLPEDKSMPVPDQKTVWHLTGDSARTLKGGGAPVKMQWNNGAGLVFERAIALDENYLFTITQRVINNSGRAQTFHPYHLTARKGLPYDHSGFYVLHEGPVAYLNKDLEEPGYTKMAKGKTIEQEGVTGWIGMTDKYWMTVLLPEKDTTFNAHMTGSGAGQAPQFQSDIVQPAVTVETGNVAENKVHAYVGVKNLKLIQAYQETYGFQRLSLSIDFGIFYFITYPMYWVFHALVALLGNIGASILVLTVIVRGLMFPLVAKSYLSMAKMKKLAPQLKELQEQYKDDKVRLQTEIMELYKREDANFFSGCWPVILQIPVFFSLYKVILISIDLRHTPFWGWINDLSAPDPTSVFNLFGLIPWTPPSVLMIGAWPCLFCMTMIIQKRLSPEMTDPVQEKVQAFFPYFITVMLAHFAAGLVIYWTWSNVLALLQQYFIQRKISGEDVSLIRGHHTRRKKKPVKHR